MNSQLYLLLSVAGVIPMVGGRSQRYFELTTRVSSPSTLRRGHLGSRSSSLEAWRPPFLVVQTVGNLESTRRQSFVVLLAVARRNRSMQHFWSITGRYIHLQLNWLYSCVATVDCDCFFDFLFLSLPWTNVCVFVLIILVVHYLLPKESTIIIIFEKYRLVYQFTQQ